MQALAGAESLGSSYIRAGRVVTISGQIHIQIDAAGIGPAAPRP